MSTIINFNPGPSILPSAVLKQAQDEFLNYRNCGYSIIEASHRGAEFEELIQRAEANIRALMRLPKEYAVLFLQGGASLQFAMIPMNLSLPHRRVDYVETGAWSERAIEEATLLGGDVHIAASSKDRSFTHIPAFDRWTVRPDSSYLHITSNNTIYGTQFHSFPRPPVGVPLIADMSSDFMSREIEAAAFGLIYAGAQKNLGPSGVTVVIMDKRLADRVPANVATMLNYKTHIKAASLYNTPPTFAIYIIALVTQQIIETGGIPAMERRNDEKAALLYATIDGSGGYYRCPAEPTSRSKMNVCIRLSSEPLEAKFLKEAQSAGMVGLKGHRSVGGIRASIYNAMPLSGVQFLAEFMNEFRRKNG